MELVLAEPYLGEKKNKSRGRVYEEDQDGKVMFVADAWNNYTKVPQPVLEYIYNLTR